jgi:hypothetical protein
MAWRVEGLLFQSENSGLPLIAAHFFLIWLAIDFVGGVILFYAPSLIQALMNKR